MGSACTPSPHPGVLQDSCVRKGLSRISVAKCEGKKAAKLSLLYISREVQIFGIDSGGGIFLSIPRTPETQARRSFQSCWTPGSCFSWNVVAFPLPCAHCQLCAPVGMQRAWMRSSVPPEGSGQRRDLCVAAKSLEKFPVLEGLRKATASPKGRGCSSLKLPGFYGEGMCRGKAGVGCAGLEAESCGVLGKIPQTQFLLLWHAWISVGILRTWSRPGILLGMLLFPGIRGVNTVSTDAVLLLGRVGNVLCSSQTTSELIQAFQTWIAGFQEVSPWISWLCQQGRGGERGTCASKLPEKRGGNSLP